MSAVNAGVTTGVIIPIMDDPTSNTTANSLRYRQAVLLVSFFVVVSSLYNASRNVQIVRADHASMLENRVRSLETQANNREASSASSTRILQADDWKAWLQPRTRFSISRPRLDQPQQQQPLNFVHIPKTGGSSIVQAAIHAGLNWGDCLFQYNWGNSRICPQKPTFDTTVTPPPPPRGGTCRPRTWLACYE